MVVSPFGKGTRHQIHAIFFRQSFGQAFEVVASHAAKDVMNQRFVIVREIFGKHVEIFVVHVQDISDRENVCKVKFRAEQGTDCRRAV